MKDRLFETWSDREKVCGKPVFYVSDVTGNKYPYDEYHNHGWGGIKRGFKDLPHDEYPYSTESKYEEIITKSKVYPEVYTYERVWKVCPFASEKESKSTGKPVERYTWFHVPVN